MQYFEVDREMCVHRSVGKGRIQSLSQEQERGLERGFPDPVKSKITVEAIETLRSLSEKLRIRRDLL